MPFSGRILPATSPAGALKASASSTGFHRRAAYAHHQHARIFADGFIINIDSYNGICAQRFGLLAQLLKRNFARFTQLFSYAPERPPTMSRIPAKKSRKMFAPRIASPVTTPQYSVMVCPSGLALLKTAYFLSSLAFNALATALSVRYAMIERIVNK